MRIKIVFTLILLLCVFALPCNAKQDTSISLDEAKKMALSYNFDLKNAKELIIQSEIFIQRAWSILLPNITAQGSITRNDEEKTINMGGAKPIVMQELWGKNASLSGSITLFNARSITQLMNAYDNNEIAELTTEKAESDLLYGVTTAYLSIVQAEKLVLSAKQAVSRSEESLKLAKSKMDVGKAIKVEVLSAEMELLEMEKMLVHSKAGRDTAKEALRILIGEKSEFNVIEPKLALSKTDYQEKDLIKKAYKNRLDIKASELKAEVAKTTEVDAWLQLLPFFMLNGMYDWTSAAGLTNDETSWRIMFTATWNIFDAGQTIADIRQAKSGKRMENNNLNSQKDLVKQDIKTAMIELDKQKTNFNSTKKQLEVAKENYEMVTRQYKVGVADNLQLVYASTKLREAEINLATNELMLQLAVYSLRQKAGYLMKVN